MKRKSKGLDLTVDVGGKNSQYLSYTVDDGTFAQGNISVSSQGILTPHSDAEEPKTDSFIKSLRDLQTVCVVGRGASSYVNKAIHVPSGRKVAVKIINIHDREKRKQLLKELNMLYSAECEHLIEFFGAFYEDGQIHIVLEYMDLHSLEDVLLRSGPMPENALGMICVAILRGLAYLHKEKRAVHRDIKPQNFCLDSEGKCKLTDFGISANLQSSFQMCDTFVGTKSYMSPERIQGQKYSYKSDIWSFGICILECALGKFPFKATDVYIELIQSIVHDPVPEVPAEFSEEFRDFIGLCLNKEPLKRPTAPELLIHPFIKKAQRSTDFNLKEWLNGLPKKRRK